MLRLELDVGDTIIVQVGDVRKFKIVAGKVVLVYTDLAEEILVYTDYDELGLSFINEQ